MAIMPGLHRQPSHRERENQTLLTLVSQSLDDSDYTYGVRRITADLKA